MKRKEVPDEVKQKEKEQLELANRNHWTVENSSSQVDTKLKYLIIIFNTAKRSFRFSVEYDTTSTSGNKVQAKDSRRTFNAAT